VLFLSCSRDSDVYMSLVQVIYTLWSGGVSIWGGSFMHSDRNLGSMRLCAEALGK
jgi:hypothetical protein